MQTGYTREIHPKSMLDSTTHQVIFQVSVSLCYRIFCEDFGEPIQIEVQYFVLPRCEGVGGSGIGLQSSVVFAVPFFVGKSS